MFPGSGYTTRPLRKLCAVWTYDERKMAVVIVNRKFIITIFDFSQIHKSSSLCNSLILPDPENKGIAVVVVYTCVILYLLPVDGHHL